MARYDDDRIAAIRAVESLRAGVPTRQTTRSLPDLRPELAEKIRGDLQGFRHDAPPPGRLVWGQYGQGKSHFLTMVEHYALDENFAVSRVTLSREVSLHNLFAFYRRAAPAIRIPNSGIPGLESRLLNLRASQLAGSPIEVPDRYSHPLPAIVLECLLSEDVSPDSIQDLYDDLMGHRLPSAEIRRSARAAGLSDSLHDLPRFRERDHATAYFALLADLTRLCGFRGLVVLIDEVELVSRLGRVSRLNAYLNMNWLLNWSGTLSFPIYTVCAAASSMADLWFLENDRRRDDRSAIPELAGERFGASDELAMVRFFEDALGEKSVTLAPVRESDLAYLLAEIIRIHGVAYAWIPPSLDRMRAHLAGIRADAPVRTHIRGLLEALDHTLLTGAIPAIEQSAIQEAPAVEEADDAPNREVDEGESRNV